MNALKCTQIMDRYLELDKNERIPIDITLHLLFCKKCRTQVRRLSIAERTASEPIKIPVPLTDRSIENVLKQINPSYSETESQNPITMRRWIVSGLLMIILLIAFGMITNRASSAALLVAFYLMFAGIVTVYCALFVGCNMDFFVKKIQTLKLAI